MKSIQHRSERIVFVKYSASGLEHSVFILADKKFPLIIRLHNLIRRILVVAQNMKGNFIEE